MPAEFDAKILKLRLPEQDELRNESECCSADPVMLQSIGRAVGQQVRITRKGTGFVALYTVKLANPEDPGNSNAARIVRTGESGRERLGSTNEMDATVHAVVLDAAPQPGEPVGVRLFDLINDDSRQSYFIAIAPHGGQIEEHTDEQAETSIRALRADGFPASLWLCKGFGDGAKGAFDRWHITSTDLQPAGFPRLQSLMRRRFCHGVAFHGFERKAGEADIYIGGGASPSIKTQVARELTRLNTSLEIKISTERDKAKFQGFSPDNLINRIALQGIHIEQSSQARAMGEQVAQAIASVYRSRWKQLLCFWT